MKVIKVRAEPKTIGTADVNAHNGGALVTKSAFYSNRVI